MQLRAMKLMSLDLQFVTAVQKHSIFIPTTMKKSLNGYVQFAAVNISFVTAKNIGTNQNLQNLNVLNALQIQQILASHFPCTKTVTLNGFTLAKDAIIVGYSVVVPAGKLDSQDQNSL